MIRYPKNLKDIRYILNHLRSEDKSELKALFKRNWKKKTLKLIKKSSTYAVIGKNKNGIPIVMGGYSALPQNKNVAGVWFLTTNEVKNHKLSMLLELKKEFEFYDTKFGLTYNILYKSNMASKKWLKWLGFRFENFFKIKNIPNGFEFFYRLKNTKGLEV
ncbi:MAG: hypothetical protein OSJ27_08955 [Candidatus Gastranaerophilales bacterium]|nr:hypothetical protein [Candidatus Gastranaerophilales bacterium]